MPGFLSAGSQTNVGGGGSSSSSSNSQAETQEISSGSDAFGFGDLTQIVGSAGRKKRELPQPADSSSFIDMLINKKKRSAANK